MRGYAFALIEHNGIVALASRHCKVSEESIANAQKAYPQFSKACPYAVDHYGETVSRFKTCTTRAPRALAQMTLEAGRAKF
jgi:hypothetical protein